MAIKFKIKDMQDKVEGKEIQIGLVHMAGGGVAVTLDGFRLIFFHPNGGVTRGQIPECLKDHISRRLDGGLHIV